MSFRVISLVSPVRVPPLTVVVPVVPRVAALFKVVIEPLFVVAEPLLKVREPPLSVAELSLKVAVSLLSVLACLLNVAVQALEVMAFRPTLPLPALPLTIPLLLF